MTQSLMSIALTLLMAPSAWAEIQFSDLTLCAEVTHSDGRPAGDIAIRWLNRIQYDISTLDKLWHIGSSAAPSRIAVLPLPREQELQPLDTNGQACVSYSANEISLLFGRPLEAMSTLAIYISDLETYQVGSRNLPAFYQAHELINQNGHLRLMVRLVRAADTQTVPAQYFKVKQELF